MNLMTDDEIWAAHRKGGIRAIERIATQRALEAAAVACWSKGMDDYLRVGWPPDQREVGSMFAQHIRAMAKELT